MKTLEMCELPYIDTKWANAIGKLALIDLLGAGLHPGSAGCRPSVGMKQLCRAQ